MKQTAVDWLAEKYNYVFWLRNRDEISAEQGDAMRAKYLKEAKELEEGQIASAYSNGTLDGVNNNFTNGYSYYHKTYKISEKNK